jgi:hypothetical protein
MERQPAIWMQHMCCGQNITVYAHFETLVGSKGTLQNSERMVQAHVLDRHRQGWYAAFTSNKREGHS